MILYLLPFKTGKEFKFGITTTDRVYDIDKLYGVDLNRAKIVHARDSKIISSIENQIKAEYREFRSTKYEGKDGWTEVLPMEQWDEVLSDINYKRSKGRLNIYIEEGVLPRARPVQPIKETILEAYTEYEEYLNSEQIFYLNHRYGRMLIDAVKSGKEKLSFSEKDFPGILDFSDRIRYLSIHSKIKKRTKKNRGYLTTSESHDWGHLFRLEFNFEIVHFHFSKYFIEDVLNGQLEFLMAGAKSASLTSIFYNQIVETEDEARIWLYYLTSGEEEFKSLCKLRGYLPSTPSPPLNYTGTKSIVLRKDIANEEEWRLLWHESLQNQKCTFEDFLVRGGYTKEGDQWVKFY